MPDEDGVWLLEQVNQQPRPIPVLLITGHAEQHIPRLAQASFTRKLVKPIDLNILVGIVRELCRGTSARVPLAPPSPSAGS